MRYRAPTLTRGCSQKRTVQVISPRQMRSRRCLVKVMEMRLVCRVGRKLRLKTSRLLLPRAVMPWPLEGIYPEVIVERMMRRGGTEHENDFGHGRAGCVRGGRGLR